MVDELFFLSVAITGGSPACCAVGRHAIDPLVHTKCWLGALNFIALGYSKGCAQCTVQGVITSRRATMAVRWCRLENF